MVKGQRLILRNLIKSSQAKVMNLEIYENVCVLITLFRFTLERTEKSSLYRHHRTRLLAMETIT